MIQRVSIAVLLLLALAGTARAVEVRPYEWEKNRGRYTLTDKEKEQTELILKQHNQYEYVLEDNQFLMYSTIHRIILVNSNEAIQKHNRIVISMNNTIDLIDLKARSINKDGKAIYFDKSNLKELKEEESGNAYRIFAMEGVELGSEVEYYFTRKMRASLFDRVFMQFDVPVKASSFMLSCPSHLKFDFRAYQGYADVKQVENDNKEVNQYSASMTDVPAMKKEAFSYYDANRKRIEFKLAYNTARSQARLYTWDEAAKTFYSLLFTTSKDDDKALEKFLKTLNDNPSKSKEIRIRNIEQKIKSTVKVNRERSEESLTQISAIVKSKLASREGITKLFARTFEMVGIKCYPVITCSREEPKFDGGFDTWSYLDEYLLYFPDTKGFLAPPVFESRYPLIPSEFTATKGLFIEPFTVGEVKSGLASIETIPASDYTLSSDNLDMDVSFSDDLSATDIHQVREFGGYNAMFFAPYYDLMTGEQQTRMIEELTKQTAPDATIGKWSAKALPDKQAGNFLIDVNFKSSHFLEKAGPRILFKVGALIGPQVEMYRDDERITEVENEFNRGYDRLIKIHIPAGYTIRNPQDIKIDITYKDKDKTPFLFQSDYTLKDNLLTITIKEYYKEIFAPLSRYEDFRKVINASADFNKVTLVLEKTK
ncbi:DUF3857 domain-containing protein [Ohtaekwangia sp.]|uniref:DUF3857 domain-containing protein n=1 Tax=Ohtaekwangia sp. TaxID=2066019 RepID=UPI002FDCD610